MWAWRCSLWQMLCARCVCAPNRHAFTPFRRVDSADSAKDSARDSVDSVKDSADSALDSTPHSPIFHQDSTPDSARFDIFANLLRNLCGIQPQDSTLDSAIFLLARYCARIRPKIA